MVKKQEKIQNVDGHSDEPETLSDKASKTSGQTAGQLLRAAREAQNIDKEVLASTLKVSMRQLDLLESDQYDALPDAAFTRNFALALGKRLDVDPQLFIGLLPKADNLAIETTHMTKMAMGGGGYALKNNNLIRGKKRSKAWLFLLIGLVIILLVLFFLLPKFVEQPAAGSNQADQTSVTGDGGSVRVISIPAVTTSQGGNDSAYNGLNTDNSASSDQPASEIPSNVVSSLTTQESPQNTNADSRGTDPDAEEEGATLVNQASANTDAEPVAAHSDQDSAPSVAQTLEIKTKTESWVVVRDKDGNMIYNAMLKASTPLSLPLSSAPFSVRVGAPNTVEVKIRGVAFDLKPYITNDGVANFKVK